MDNSFIHSLSFFLTLSQFPIKKIKLNKNKLSYCLSALCRELKGIYRESDRETKTYKAALFEKVRELLVNGANGTEKKPN